MTFDLTSAARNFRAYLESPAHVILIDSEARGMLIGVKTPWMLNNAYNMAIELAWWVKPEHRGSRVAIELMKAYEAWARQNSVRILVMAALTDSDGERVGQIYERLGFKKYETSYAKELN